MASDADYSPIVEMEEEGGFSQVRTDMVKISQNKPMKELIKLQGQTQEDQY